MPRSYRHTSLPPPYLKRVWIDEERIPDREAYPFCLPMFREPNFELEFETPVTIIVGENGTGKSTLLEGIAALAGFDEAGGGPGYRPVDHSNALEENGGLLAQAMKASWLPKVGQGGSSARKASSPSRAISTMRRGRAANSDPTSFRTRTAKASCVSSTSAASRPACSSSTSLKAPSPCRGSSNF